jgi:hypothetical protein
MRVYLYRPVKKEDMALKYGLYKEHFYLISEVHTSTSSVRETLKSFFIKIHNPFNTKEKIKSSEKYSQLEAKLKQQGVAKTSDAEFWMTYESFLKCFRRVKVCNLQPDKKIAVQMTPEVELVFSTIRKQK